MVGLHATLMAKSARLMSGCPGVGLPLMGISLVSGAGWLVSGGVLPAMSLAWWGMGMLAGI